MEDGSERSRPKAIDRDNGDRLVWDEPQGRARDEAATEMGMQTQMRERRRQSMTPAEITGSRKIKQRLGLSEIAWLVILEKEGDFEEFTQPLSQIGEETEPLRKPIQTVCFSVDKTHYFVLGTFPRFI